MKKLNNQSVLFGSIFMIVAIAVFTFFIFDPNNPQPEKNLSYLEKFSGFNQGTTIQTTYFIDKSSIVEKSLSIQEENVTLNNNLELTLPYRVSYSIQDKDKIIDINVVQTSTQVKASLAGLEQSSLVNLNLNNGATATAIPVDWAGRIELKTASQTENTEYCILIEDNKNIQEICHNGKRQVKS